MGKSDGSGWDDVIRIGDPTNIEQCIKSARNLKACKVLSITPIFNPKIEEVQIVLHMVVKEKDKDYNSQPF